MMLRLRANVVLLRSNGNMTFKNKVKKYIIEKELVENGDRVLCALSGGGDSVALMMILKELESELDFTLCAAHFNHGIRGAEADRDQEFSRELCEKLQIPFFTATEDVPRMAKENGEGLEECARERRYKFLFDTAREQSCTKIATAHHATDNTETVLFHMIRGSGINGLGGIAPKRNDGVIRPLLCVTRTEIEAFLEAGSQKFVTDSTNADTDMTRNFIRLRILPLVKEINPAADKAIARLSDAAREDEEYFVEEAGKIPKNAPLSRLRTVPTPILKRYILLRYADARSPHAQLDYDALAAICDVIREGKPRFRYSVSGDISVIGERDTLSFITSRAESQPYCFTVEAMGEYKTSEGTVLVTDNETVAGAFVNGRKGAYVSLPVDPEGWSFTVRSAAEGDKYLRGKIHRAVRKELNAIGYPARKRAALPRFCDGDGIFWIPHLPIGDKLKNIPKENSKQLIYIGYTEN